PDGDDLVLARKNDLPHTPALLAVHRIGDDAIRLFARGSVRHEVIHTAVEIDRINFVLRDEGIDRQRPLLLGPQGFELLRVDVDIFALTVFVAGDHLVVAHLAVNRTDLLVVDSPVAGRMELMKMDVALLPVESIDRLDWK